MDEASKTSPAPWGYIASFRVVTDAEGRILAELMDMPTVDVSEGNGPLIASAPEMLTLLRELVDRWNREYHCCIQQDLKLPGHSEDCPLTKANAFLDRLGRSEPKAPEEPKWPPLPSPDDWIWHQGLGRYVRKP